jgi:hypothetical protein
MNKNHLANQYHDGLLVIQLLSNSPFLNPPCSNIESTSKGNLQSPNIKVSGLVGLTSLSNRSTFAFEEIEDSMQKLEQAVARLKIESLK